MNLLNRECEIWYATLPERVDLYVGGVSLSVFSLLSELMRNDGEREGEKENRNR